MNKTAMVFAMVIVLTAVFAIASPMDAAMAQTSVPVSDGEGNSEYGDGEHKDGKSCPFKERKAQEQSS